MKVRIGKRGIPTTHHGYLEPGSEHDLPDWFARYVAERMNAGEILKVRRARSRKKAAE